MRALVDGDELVHLDLGVLLRGRERGVTEQLLNRAQIAACREQVSREAVAERVRCGRLQQAQASGAVSLRQIAQALDAEGIPAPRGGEWFAATVARAMARA